MFYANIMESETIVLCMQLVMLVSYFHSLFVFIHRYLNDHGILIQHVYFPISIPSFSYFDAPSMVDTVQLGYVYQSQQQLQLSHWCCCYHPRPISISNLADDCSYPRVVPLVRFENHDSVPQSNTYCDGTSTKVDHCLDRSSKMVDLPDLPRRQ